MIVLAVLPEIHALPGAEGESALGDRDGEVHGGEGGAHMGGHIVGALVIMLKHWVAVGADACHEAFEIAPYAGVGIFLYNQRGAGVLQMQGGQAGGEPRLFDQSFQFAGQIMKLPAAGGHVHGVGVLRKHGERLRAVGKSSSHEDGCGRPRDSRAVILQEVDGGFIGPRGGVVRRFKPPGGEEGVVGLALHFTKEEA